MLAGLRVVPARAHHPAVVAVEVALLRHRNGGLVPRVAHVDGVAERVVGDEGLLVDPVLVEGAAEHDPQAEVDVDQVVGDQLAVHDDAGGDVHRLAPLVHGRVAVVDDVRVLPGAPAAQQDAALADLLVAGQCLVEEVEHVVVHRHRLLHEVDDVHEPAQVVGEGVRLRHRADPARVQRRRVDVAPLHQAEHLPGDPADLERLLVDLALEGVERLHDVGDGPVAVDVPVRRVRALGAGQQPGVGGLDHRLAEVHEDQVVLEDGVVEHVLGRFAEVGDVLGQLRRLDAVGHLLGVVGARGVVVAADAADARGDEPGVARVLALHEHRVAAEQRRGAVALHDFPVREVDLRVDAQVADDPGDRIPGHVHDLCGLAPFGAGLGGRHLRYCPSLFGFGGRVAGCWTDGVTRASAGRSRWSACACCGATWARGSPRRWSGRAGGG